MFSTGVLSIGFKRLYAGNRFRGWNKLFSIRFFTRYVVQVERNYLAVRRNTSNSTTRN